MARRTTIGHVLTSLHVGGAERVALMLAQQQVKDGHRVVVLSYDAPSVAGALATEFERAGVAVHRIKKHANIDWSLPWRSARALSRVNIDVVHTHNDLPLVYMAAPARLLRRRLVHTTHGQHRGSRRQLWLRRAAARLVHRYVAVSQATAEYALSLGEVSPHKLEVILNGTDLMRFRPDAAARARLRQRWGLSADARVVGTVGRLAQVKNQPLLIKALAPLLKNGACDALLLVGGGPQRAALITLAKQLGVANEVRFIGEISYVHKALSAMDVFALSSHSEGLPLVLAEAMACGLPVVATDVGGVAKVVDHGTTGYVVAAGDEAALRQRLAALLTDSALAQALGARGRELAQQRYSMTRMAADYARVYGIR